VSNGGAPRLFARLGCVEGRRVLRLTVDDHYVIVGFADGGEQRLLMRFADAVREMEGQDGFLTHRSHWVSADSVVRAWRSGGRDIVELVDGSTVPVSRTYRATLESRGLLGPLAVQVPAVTE
jgi:DNA-binding LytR/AlgR family response regulator